MGLNIKNERITALVRELAKRTGMTQTGAIEDAVRHRLADLDEEDSAGGSRNSEARQASVRQLLDELRRSLTQAERNALRGAQESLYDDTGLPA
jgi:antitoxin VapB